MYRRFILPTCVVAILFLLLSACRNSKSQRPPEVVENRSLLTTQFKLPRRGTPVSDFERLANWSVFSGTGSVQLNKNLSQSIWGRRSAEIIFSPEGKGPHNVRLTPAEPWQIQSQFDTILIWVLDEAEAGLRKDRKLVLRYRDAHGAVADLKIAYRPQPGWQMLHLRLREHIASPAQIESLYWELPSGVLGKQRLLLDAMSIYQEVLNSIPQKVHYVRPFEYAPVFAPLRKNSVTLDFPTRPAAYRPDTHPEKFIQKLSRLDGGRFLFTYESTETQLSYRVHPQPGMPKIDIILDGKLYENLWQHAQVKASDAVPELRFARMLEDSLMLQYTQGLQIEVSLHGKTLQLQMNSLLENVASFQLGTLSAPGAARPRVVNVPLMRVRKDLRWPVFSLNSGDSHFLMSVIPDWWYSLASRYQEAPGSTLTDEVPLGAMLYEKRWRGSRNMFRERIYLSVSKRLQDVLPSPASPVGMARKELGEVSWRAGVKLPTSNLMSVKPIETGWEDRFVARTPQGEWLEHPIEGFVLKSGLFDDLPLKRLQKLREEETGTLLNVPAVAQFPPWRFLDRDVRSVGASTYTQTLSEAGALMQQVEADWGGGISSRGGSEWFWTGLVSGIGPDFPLGLLELHPLLPQFSWRNVHPYSQIFGLGTLDDFRLPTDELRSEGVLLNRLLAMQVAYGALGRVPVLQAEFLKTKAERIQNVLQPHFAAARSERIAYWNGKRFLNAGEALKEGVLKKSNLYIRLDNQTEIWVNGDLFDEWSIRVDGRDLTLPPFGFVVRGNDLFVLNSPKSRKKDGLTLLEAKNKIWVSSPGQEVEELTMRIHGCLQILKGDDGVVQIDIADWHGEARLSANLLQLDEIGSIRAVDHDGKTINDVFFQRKGDDWLLQSDERLRRIWISPEISGRDLKFSP